ncbi:hypothetical protein B0H19DRAFT_371939 [Mycena capillaripes]|nr:hypothetical protein B0H19DRAFT_371939 [Mycena capillaripes]
MHSLWYTAAYIYPPSFRSRLEDSRTSAALYSAANQYDSTASWLKLKLKIRHSEHVSDTQQITGEPGRTGSGRTRHTRSEARRLTSRGRYLARHVEYQFKLLQSAGCFDYVGCGIEREVAASQAGTGSREVSGCGICQKMHCHDGGARAHSSRPVRYQSMISFPLTLCTPESCGIPVLFTRRDLHAPKLAGGSGSNHSCSPDPGQLTILFDSSPLSIFSASGRTAGLKKKKKKKNPVPVVCCTLGRVGVGRNLRLRSIIQHLNDLQGVDADDSR